MLGRARRLTALGLTAIFLLALWLRVSGNEFGLPHHYAHDEPTKVADARRLVENGFRHSHYQPSLLFNSLWLVGLAGSPGRARWEASRPHREHVSELEREIEYDLWLARCWMALLGALTVVPVYFVGVRLRGPPAGLLGAALCAVTPLSVAGGHFVKEDVPLALLVTLSLLATMRLAERPTPRRYLVAGAAVGAATAAKWAGAAALVLVVLAHRLGRRGTRRDLLRALAAAAVTYVVLSPNAILMFRRAAGGFVWQAAYVLRGHHDGLAIDALDGRLTFYLRHALLDGLTPLVLALSLAGLVLLWRMRRRAPGALLALGWTGFYYLLLEVIPAKPYPFYERYALPILPALCAAAGVAGAGLVAHARDATRGRTLLVPAAVLLLSAAVLWPAGASVLQNESLAHDPRDAAEAWMRRHLPPGAPVPRTALAPHLHDRETPFLDDPALTAFLDGAPGAPEYCVVSSLDYQRFFDWPDEVPARTALWQRLSDEAHLVAEFVPAYPPHAHANGTIRVYARR